LGYAWHHVTGVYDNFNNPTFLSGAEPNGAIVGGQLGYNWRMDWFLLGVELDADTGANSNTVVDTLTGGQITGSLSYLASARARIGVLWGPVLFYGTGGVGSARYTFNEASAPSMPSSTSRILRRSLAGVSSGWLPTACRCGRSICATT
jgi:outer membrane immunogenic protein